MLKFVCPLPKQETQAGIPVLRIRRPVLYGCISRHTGIATPRNPALPASMPMPHSINRETSSVVEYGIHRRHKFHGVIIKEGYIWRVAPATSFAIFGLAVCSVAVVAHGYIHTPNTSLPCILGHVISTVVNVLVEC